MMVVMACGLSACATLQERFSPDSDRITSEFFDDLQKIDRQAAYGLFAKGLSQTITFGQFDELMASMENQWGRIAGFETALMPFHQRTGERDFIPFGVPNENIKRYIYEVKYDRGSVNCDLTLVPQEGQYKIAWISFWGSSVGLTPAMREKLETPSPK